MSDNSRQKSRPCTFDRKLGEGFIATIPLGSGVYLFRNESGAVIYVGKAKSLRRRLAQYRLAPRRKKYLKMRLIVQAASALEFIECETEKEALLLENRLIQELRPEFNVAQAYSFLYPFLGIKWGEAGDFHLCYTTSPDELEALGFELFGAFRNRLVVKAAFESLSELFSFIGHISPSDRKRIGHLPFTRMNCFRQVPKEWDAALREFLRGEGTQLLAEIFQHLLEKAGARRAATEIQSYLDHLKVFYGSESKTLRLVLKAKGMNHSKIAQNERDALFLEHGGSQL